MKTSKVIRNMLVIAGLFASLISCSKNESTTEPEPVDPNIEIQSATKTGTGFSYKVFFQEEISNKTRRGIIILAVGDGGNINDVTLNDQCDAMARKGFVAITTTYRTNSDYYAGFKEDMEQIINKETMAFDIARNKVVLGGLSRGGNRLHGSVLPGQMNNVPPIKGIKGLILECAGGDEWKGSALLFPVLFMNNKVDAQVQTTDAETFKNGLQNNSNPGVKDLSHCLIVAGSGHCSQVATYKDFILEHIDSWF